MLLGDGAMGMRFPGNYQTRWTIQPMNRRRWKTFPALPCHPRRTGGIAGCRRRSFPIQIRLCQQAIRLLERAHPEPLPIAGRLHSPNRDPDDLIGDGTVSSSSPRGVQQPRVTIEKIAPKNGNLGEPLVYSVLIKNVGGTEVQMFVIEDRIPKGTELTGTSPRAELIDRKLVWKIGALRPNEERKISIRVIPRQEGSIGSVARVSFATEVATDIAVVGASIGVHVVNAPQARLGEHVEMTFLLKNTGSAPATNVTVRDIVPDGLKHEAASDIECPIGKLEPGESREIVLTMTAVKPGRVVNRAILSGDSGISQELETPINIVGELLALTRSGNNKIYVDRPSVFKNNVRNDGGFRKSSRSAYRKLSRRGWNLSKHRRGDDLIPWNEPSIGLWDRCLQAPRPK